MLPQGLCHQAGASVGKRAMIGGPSVHFQWVSLNVYLIVLLLGPWGKYAGRCWTADGAWFASGRGPSRSILCWDLGPRESHRPKLQSCAGTWLTNCTIVVATFWWRVHLDLTLAWNCRAATGKPDTFGDFPRQRSQDWVNVPGAVHAHCGVCV